MIFFLLSISSQLLLLEEGWRELFILGAAQWQMQFDPSPLMIAAGLKPDNAPTEKIAAVTSELKVLQEIIAKFRQLEVDATEFACLKGIVIFKTGECVCGDDKVTMVT